MEQDDILDESYPYQVLLYYHYTDIEDPEVYAKRHKKFCESLNLLGRILIAKEGINGTVSGTTPDTKAYMEAMQADPLFAGITFKIDGEQGHVFKKLICKPRPELVTLRLEKDVNPREKTGKYLSPKEFYEAMQDDDVVIVDVRNSYEYDLGHFRGAIRPPVKTTKEFPKWVKEFLSQYKDKKVLTYCTGGIRCEKFSAYLLEEGFKDVSQLHGGIVTYGKDPEVKGKLFDGSCYVFDSRVTVPVNHTEEATTVGRCLHCNEPCERFVNCANTLCDNQHLCCVDCEFKYKRSCSPECAEAEMNEFDPATAGTSKSHYR